MSSSSLPCPACGERLVPRADRFLEWPPHGDGCAAGELPLLMARPMEGTRSPWPSPLMRAAVALARAYYELPGCEVGGSLHVVVDDDNTAAVHVEWCRDRAMRINDDMGVRLGNLLLCLTEDQRDWVCRTVHSDRFPDLGRRPYSTGVWRFEEVTCPEGRRVVAPFAARLGVV